MCPQHLVMQRHDLQTIAGATTSCWHCSIVPIRVIIRDTIGMLVNCTASGKQERLLMLTGHTSPYEAHIYTASMQHRN